MTARVSGEMITLPPVDSLFTPLWTEVMKAEFGEATARELVLQSQSGLPFEAKIEWSTGNAASFSADISVAHAERLTITAISVRVTCLNKTNKDNLVILALAPEPGFSGGLLTKTHVVHIDTEEGEDLKVPPFCNRVLVQLKDPALASEIEVSAIDQLGIVWSTTRLDKVPADGLSITGICRYNLKWVPETVPEETERTEAVLVYPLNL